MTRDEFLQQLREALENDLQGQIVQENVDYYNQYISEEVHKGTAEQEVIDNLGDPWILARTVIDSVDETKYSSTVYEAGESGSSRGPEPGKAYIFGLDTWWKRLLVILMIAGILILVVAIVGGLLSLLMPILVPLFIVVVLIRVLNKK